MTVTRNPRLLSAEQLAAAVDAGEIDTVVVAFTDMQGRLQGKRLHADYFVSDVLGHGTEGCNYTLATDVEMTTVDGYALTSWDAGYGDMEIIPDPGTLRRLAHLPGTVMVQADLAWADGRPVTVSPRSILARQTARAAAHGWEVLAGTELEFIIFDTSYEAGWAAGYAPEAMTPANQYNVDYSILGTTRVEPLLREIRRVMHAAGLVVEGAKGECNLGQHEITFKYADALTTADNHAVYKNTAKEIAAAAGKSITFMAKYNQAEGSSCHIHMSLRGTGGSDSTGGELVFWDADEDDRSLRYDRFIAGVLATMAEFTLLYAPNINSYKRFADGSFAPTTIGWGRDNRTCAVRLVGSGADARLENRLPGADVNPYLGLAATLAGGLYGIENGLELEEELTGNAYVSGKPRVPRTLRAARDAFASSAIARAAFGDEVVDHYTRAADVELAAFETAVTDWERRRGFERL